MASKSQRTFESDLGLLETFLLSDNVSEDAMLLSELDGYLTGIVVGPEMIMPSEWTPLIWGSMPPDFVSESQASSIMSLIMARYNQIIEDLTFGSEEYEPILAFDTDGSQFAEIWAEGFMAAVGLRGDAWSPIFESTAGAAASLIMALTIPEMMEDFADDEDTAEVTKAISKDLSTSVVAIDRFWKSKRGVVSATARPGSKIGRNVPCPCGSGKKYKKCCGLN